MASYRKNRINEDLLRVLPQIIRELKDPRINSAFLTVTHCDVSGDLKYAKIYFSVLNGDPDEVKKGLVSAKGYIRRAIAERLNMRSTPELTFISDDSIEKGAQINKILNDITEMRS
ncbi:MAG: 30S ribosome-binding factor RbfA [Oscillospiraceae bacterium]|nr:30S ribosome-binding factor RbfA [Oscillospiraceae bacterium]